MMAAPSTNDRYEALMASAKERAARAAANASISVTVEREIVRMPADGQMKQSSERPFPVCQFSAIEPKQAVAVPTETIDANPLPAKDAQFAALQRMGLIGLKSRADDIFLVIATACRAGTEDLTGREIQALYERRYGRRIESGTISARVSELLAARRILRRPQSRVCTVTREMAAPVYVVMKQVRMEY
jgi:hypothetical protein